MGELETGLRAMTPKSFFQKPLKIEYAKMLAALSAGIGYAFAGEWPKTAASLFEALGTVKFATVPEELVYRLVNSSLIDAVFRLVADSASQILLDSSDSVGEDTVEIGAGVAKRDVYITRHFLERPSEIELIEDATAVLTEWLEAQGVGGTIAATIAARLPSYFVHSLDQEWKAHLDLYEPLLQYLETPFAGASERERSWSSYATLLQRRADESVFEESFGLRQIYVPLNASRAQGTVSEADWQRVRPGSHRVVSLDTEIRDWLGSKDSDDAIRMISGGPGSGKSSFSRILAAQVAAEGRMRVLFVPLHLIDPTRDFESEINRFASEEGIESEELLAPESNDVELLLILDGLDELSIQGQTQVVRDFVHEVERTVQRKNSRRLRLRVLLSGREVTIQEHGSGLRHPDQVLTLMPYFVPPGKHGYRSPEGEAYVDPGNLLQEDKRNVWWATYGALTGQGFQRIPAELSSTQALVEVSAQPLLNYLLALSYVRGRLDFGRTVNLNSLYADLIAAVHERAYEKNRRFVPTSHMTLEDFGRVLEEIGLAAWHGSGRSATVAEIEAYCSRSGLEDLLARFKQGAEAGVTRLLAAFFFRQYGKRETGDPTFVFTHKSFGEYLAAMRVVRAVEEITRDMGVHDGDPYQGCDVREALGTWIGICGPTALTEHIFEFLTSEFRLRDRKGVLRLQVAAARLLGSVLRNQMPMEHARSMRFEEMLTQSINAGETLLGVHSACARVTGELSSLGDVDPEALGAWFKQIQGQRVGPSIAMQCMNHLDMGGFRLEGGDFRSTNFGGSSLREAEAKLALLVDADFTDADLSGIDLTHANLRNADLTDADLSDARLTLADLTDADLTGTRLIGSDLRGTDLSRANLRNADLTDADLSEARLDHADLTGATIVNACVAGAEFEYAELSSANLTGTDLRDAEPVRSDLANSDVFDSGDVYESFVECIFADANALEANFIDGSLQGVEDSDSTDPDSEVNFPVDGPAR